ncbi:MAG: HAMP domain-containing methyl-accepting chemotaxis protein, partial [Rhodospirillaceae bacterium]
ASTMPAVHATMVLTIVLAFVGIVLAFLITRRLLAASNLLRRAADIMKRASRGDFNARIVRIARKDEIGDLLNYTNQLMDLTEAFVKEAGAAMQYAGKKKYFRRIIEDGMHGEFVVYVRRINSVIAGMETRDAEIVRFSERQVMPVIVTTTSKVEELRRSAETLNTIARQSIERSMVVASAATQATCNVQTVAAATVQLSASICEINRHMGESSRQADEAVNEVRIARQTVDGLNIAAEKIGGVVKLIHSIAGRTNLLALNATIEAARAGEAGKGFSVVASEVKNLANQTARATEEITTQVHEMQRITTETVAAIQGVGNRIGSISQNVLTVADEMNAQAAAISDINRNVHEAATGTDEVARNIMAVTDGARETQSMAASVLGASNDLANQASGLQQDVAQFVDKVHSAA